MTSLKKIGQISLFLISVCALVVAPSAAYSETSTESTSTQPHAPLELVQSLRLAGVSESKIPTIAQKLLSGEPVDALTPGATPVSESETSRNGIPTTTFTYADGSATTTARVSTTTGTPSGQISTRGVAAGLNSCKKRISGKSEFYTGCNAWAWYLWGNARFKFDFTYNSGTRHSTITAVYGGGCDGFCSASNLRIVRKSSTNRSSALAEMTVSGSPLKGFGTSQHLHVTIAKGRNLDVLPNYGAKKL